MLSWLGANLGTVLAVVAIVVAWGIYRTQQASARQGVLDALRAELDLHRSWVGHGYELGTWPDPKDPRGGWWARERLRDMKEHTPFVNKLLTVAIDAAIAEGHALFINPELVIALVHYRQRVGHLNQLIDNALAFGAAPELWTAKPAPALVDHFAELTAAIHWIGIGPSDHDGAHALYIVAVVQVVRELKVNRVDWLAWFCVGRTWPRPKTVKQPPDLPSP